MSLNTFSKFYYGHTITSENNLIDFNEGGPELTATMSVGNYSLEEFILEIKRALDAAGAFTYTVTVNRGTRIITISATGTFSILASSGSHTSGSYALIGFSSDQTGASSYSGSSGSGSVFSPQFVLQDHIGSDHDQRSVDASVIRSASGRVEVVTFGTEKFVSAKIRYATNIVQPSGVITSSSTGVSDLTSFMQYITTKGRFEYMPDKDVPSVYETLILESSDESQQGTGYRLRERYDVGLPGYFDTSILKFRVIE